MASRVRRKRRSRRTKEVKDDVVIIPSLSLYHHSPPLVPQPSASQSPPSPPPPSLSVSSSSTIILRRFSARCTICHAFGHDAARHCKLCFKLTHKTSEHKCSKCGENHLTAKHECRICHASDHNPSYHACNICGDLNHTRGIHQCDYCIASHDTDQHDFEHDDMWIKTFLQIKENKDTDLAKKAKVCELYEPYEVGMWFKRQYTIYQLIHTVTMPGPDGIRAIELYDTRPPTMRNIGTHSIGFYQYATDSLNEIVTSMPLVLITMIIDYIRRSAESLCYKLCPHCRSICGFGIDPKMIQCGTDRSSFSTTPNNDYPCYSRR